MEETEHGTLSLQFRQHAGGADGLGNFHLFLAQSLQIIPIQNASCAFTQPPKVSPMVKSGRGGNSALYFFKASTSRGLK
jgi:hypothetical protein